MSGLDLLFSNASILVFLSEFMIKYWKNNWGSLICESGMSSMMSVGVFEDFSKVIFDHQASNSNFFFNLEYLMKIWEIPSSILHGEELWKF